MDFASENQDASGIQAAKLGSRPGNDAQSVAKRYVPLAGTNPGRIGSGPRC